MRTLKQALKMTVHAATERELEDQVDAIISQQSEHPGDIEHIPGMRWSFGHRISDGSHGAAVEWPWHQYLTLQSSGGVICGQVFTT